MGRMDASGIMAFPAEPLSKASVTFIVWVIANHHGQKKKHSHVQHSNFTHTAIKQYIDCDLSTYLIHEMARSSQYI